TSSSRNSRIATHASRRSTTATWASVTTTCPGTAWPKALSTTTWAQRWLLAAGNRLSGTLPHWRLAGSLLPAGCADDATPSDSYESLGFLCYNARLFRITGKAFVRAGYNA